MLLKRVAVLSSAMVAAAVTFAPAADAQERSPQLCGLRADIVKQLSKLYRESPIAVGIADDGRLLEVVAADDGATWTALVTRSDGTSCVMLTGQSWQGQLHQNLAQLRK